MSNRGWVWPIIIIACCFSASFFGIRLGQTSSSPPPIEAAKMADAVGKCRSEIEETNESVRLLIRVLTSAQKTNSSDPTGKLGASDIEGKLARILDAMEKNRLEGEAIKESIQRLSKDLVASKPDSGDLSSKPLPTGTDSKLARILVTPNPKEKQQLVEDHLLGSQKIYKLELENVHLIAAELQGKNAILTSPEHLEPKLLDQVEKERDRLLALLKSQIPPLVKELDDQATKTETSKEALRAWAKAGAVLGYYPASNIPGEAEVIQKIVTDHETVRTRIAILQRQRYNQWVLDRIKKAWLDFNGSGINQQKLETCRFFLGPIEVSHLEPITMELYRDFLEAIKKKVSSDEYQSLASSLTNAKRLMPGDTELK